MEHIKLHDISQVDDQVCGWLADAYVHAADRCAFIDRSGERRRRSVLDLTMLEGGASVAALRAVRLPTGPNRDHWFAPERRERGRARRPAASSPSSAIAGGETRVLVRAGAGLMWRHVAADALMVSRPRQMTAIWDRDGWHAERMALPVWFQRVESAAVAALVVVALVQLGFAWWWLLAVFLLWDLSMVGYLASPRLGAISYNLGHSYLGPAVLLAVTWASDARWPAFVALTWAFHIAVDRLLGYGLKFTDRFSHTHLGEIGQGRQGAPTT